MRCTQEDFKPTQRLLCQEVLAKTLKGEELAHRMSCLAVVYKFGPWVIIRATTNGRAVNGADIRQVTLFYADVTDVVEFSHTFDNVRSNFEFQVLDSFSHFWIVCFSQLQRSAFL